MPLALPFAIVLLILQPPFDVLLVGRDIQEEFATDGASSPPAHPLAGIVKLAALGLLGASLLLDPRKANFREISNPVFRAFLIYFATNVLACAAFGRHPAFPILQFESFLVPLAIYCRRSAGIEPIIDAARWALLIMMAASFAADLAWPNMTRRIFDPEVRIAAIPYRFWGLGSHANNIAPMASGLILLTLHRPFARVGISAMSVLLGIAVLVMTQSQTTWAATVLALAVMPLAARYGDRWHLPAFIRSPLFLAPLLVLALGLLIALLVAPPDSKAILDSTFEVGNEVMTGRGNAWQVAVENFLANPVFGYGLTIWSAEFRYQIGLSWAVHAHNQILQSLSVAGLVGLTGLLFYSVTLWTASIRAARQTKGLAPALAVVCLVRSVTEIPLDLSQVTLDVTLIHVLLFGLVVARPRPVTASDALPMSATAMAPLTPLAGH